MEHNAIKKQSLKADQKKWKGECERERERFFYMLTNKIKINKSIGKLR